MKHSRFALIYILMLLASNGFTQSNAPRLRGPGVVCRDAPIVYMLENFTTNVIYTLSYVNGTGPVSFVGGATSITVTWHDEPSLGCNRVSGATNGQIRAKANNNEPDVLLDVIITGLGEPGAISGPSTLRCESSFTVSTTPGFNAETHIWTGLPAGWSVSCNNSDCSNATITIPETDCNNYDLNIGVLSARPGCTSASCPSQTPLKLKRTTVPIPSFSSTCPLVCSAGDQYTVTLNNIASYTSVTWSTTGNLTGVSANGLSTYTVAATSSAGPGSVYCTLSSPCCTKTFLASKANFGPPTVTYLNIVESLCPEYSAETDLLGCLADRYVWKWYKEPFSGFYNTKTTAANSTKLIFSDGPGTYRVAVSATNRCGTSNEVFARVVVPDCRGNDGGGHLIGDGTDRSDNESVVEKVKENGTKAATLLEPEIYPNPTEGSFTVKFPTDFYNEQQYSIKIFDGLGKCLFTQNGISESQYDITNWQHEPGIYFIQVQVNNMTTITRKLIVR